MNVKDTPDETWQGAKHEVHRLRGIAEKPAILAHSG